MEHAVLIALGIVQLAVAWVCWSGRWRGWADMTVLPLAPVTVLPALGLLFIALGVGPLVGTVARGVLYAITLTALAVAVVVWLWQPHWSWPAWYDDYRPRPETNGRPPA